MRLNRSAFFFAAIVTLAPLVASSSVVRPSRPSEDDNVSILVHSSGGSGCRIQTSVSHVRGRGRTHLKGVATPVGRCRTALQPGGHWALVGKLKSGRYVVTYKGKEISFMVRPGRPVVDPVETKPGKPNYNRIRKTIVRRDKPGLCFGMPSPVTDKDIAAFKKRHRKWWKAAGRLFEPKDDTERLTRARQLMAIKFTHVRRATWRYEYRDGGCCTIRTWEGEVQVAPEINVGPRRILSTSSSPC